MDDVLSMVLNPVMFDIIGTSAYRLKVVMIVVFRCTK